MKETASSVTKEYTYLGGDAYSAPVVAVTQSGATTYYYLLRDYLGNITHVYNSSNSTTQEYSFDAWGRRRNATDWSSNLADQPELFASRGFTSHEHLPWFNLINMNGRLCDPLVGRFISPDLYVQVPDFTQNFNRYAYCVNNPLKYTDKNRQWFGWDDLCVALVGGTINWVMNGCRFDGKGLTYFGTGAVDGLATYYGGPFAGAAVLGAGNNLTQQVSQNGWGGVNWSQTMMSASMSIATAYVRGQISNKISPDISNWLSDLTNSLPVQQALSQGLTNGIAGFSINTGMSLINGNDLETSLKTGGKGALSGLGMGV